jgi:hypothetical protein
MVALITSGPIPSPGSAVTVVFVVVEAAVSIGFVSKNGGYVTL